MYSNLKSITNSDAVVRSCGTLGKSCSTDANCAQQPFAQSCANGMCVETCTTPEVVSYKTGNTLYRCILPLYTPTDMTFPTSCQTQISNAEECSSELQRLGWEGVVTNHITGERSTAVGSRSWPDVYGCMVGKGTVENGWKNQSAYFNANNQGLNVTEGNYPSYWYRLCP